MGELFVVFTAVVCLIAGSAIAVIRVIRGS
jgi:hypothetical protein